MKKEVAKAYTTHDPTTKCFVEGDIVEVSDIFPWSEYYILKDDDKDYSILIPKEIFEKEG